MRRTQLIALALILVLVSVPLLGCGLCRSMADSAQKLFGTKEETTTPETSGTVVETQLPPPPLGTSQDNAPLEILTQRRGNHTRTAILDAIRYYSGMRDEKGSLFVVLWLGKKGNWAMMQGRTENEGTEAEALVRWVPSAGVWRVVGFSKNAGWRQVTRAGYPEAPKEIFSGTRGWPKEQASSSGGSSFRNLTNKKGDPTRTAILDAARASMGGEINGRKIVFTVKWMATQDGWAYFVGEEYNVKLPFDKLLRRSGGWSVVDTQGEGDFPRTIRQKNPDLPQAIFDGYP